MNESIGRSPFGVVVSTGFGKRKILCGALPLLPLDGEARSRETPASEKCSFVRWKLVLMVRDCCWRRERL